VINETNFNGFPKNVTVNLTDENGNVIVGNGFPVTANNIAAHTTVGVMVPAAPNGIKHCDAINTWQAVAAAGGGGGSPVGVGAQAVVRLESYIFDPNLRRFQMESIFDFLGHAVGDGVFISVPDLWADTNGDGQIGDGDVLYSLVNLRAFLNN